MGDVIATYYLKNSDGCVVARFDAEKITEWYIDGKCYSAISWFENNVVCDWHFVCDVCCKFDGCTHWYFKGEDTYDDEGPHDSYYHLCGAGIFADHIRCMCFVWKLAYMLMTDAHYDKNEDPGHLDNYYWDTEEIEALCKLMLDGYSIVKGEKPY